MTTMWAIILIGKLPLFSLIKYFKDIKPSSILLSNPIRATQIFKALSGKYLMLLSRKEYVLCSKFFVSGTFFEFNALEEKGDG